MKNIATWIRECDEPHFARVFANYPDLRLHNARTSPVLLDEMDALLLTGGSDISAGFLRQPVPEPSPIEDANPDRDGWEFPALKWGLGKRAPLFAICRGLQVLNVALGGTLHLDIPNHDDPRTKYGNFQELCYVPGVLLQIPQVNSSHHQALDQLGEGLIVEARFAGDGVVEQARLVDYPFGLGVQYHPERDPIYRPLFDGFVLQVRQGKT